MAASLPAQQVPYNLHVINTSNSQSVNPNVWLNITPPSGTKYSIKRRINPFIGFRDTLPAGTLIESFTYDCNGNVSINQVTLPSVPDYYDTLYISCYQRTLCVGGYQQLINGSNNLYYEFQNTSTIPPIASNQGEYRYIYDFGDGVVDTVFTPQAITTHNFSAPGVYTVCMTAESEDTVNNFMLCSNTQCQTFVVGNVTLNCAKPTLTGATSASILNVNFLIQSNSGSNTSVGKFFEIEYGDGNSA